MFRFAITLVLLLFGCAEGGKEPAVDFGSPGDRYFLKPDEIRRLEQDAGNGDMAAVRRLVQHYSLASHDLERRIHWQRRLADSGEVASMLNLSVSLKQVGGEQECKEAARWIAKAAASTDDPALLRGARLNRESLVHPGSLCFRWTRE